MARMRVFVSHSSADKASCDALVSALRGAGADVWYDEHNLGAGMLRDEIMRELAARPVTLVLLSKAAFASQWVRDECEWAYNLYRREPNRMLLPVVVGAYEPRDFNSLLYLESLKRIEGPGNSPYPINEIIARTLALLSVEVAQQRLVAVSPQPEESVDDLLTQGNAQYSQKKYAEALPFFQRATQLDPNNFEAWITLANTLNQLQRFAEALAADERATTLDPNHFVAWFNTASTLISLKRYAEALSAAERGTTLAPDFSDAWSMKANALTRLNRYDEALAACDRATTLWANNIWVWTIKADALNGLKRYDEALEACEKATTLEPNGPYEFSALVNKGVAFNALRRYSEALLANERAIALVPDNEIALVPDYATAWRGKVIALRGLGREADAQEAERRAKALGG
jgi:tetratricopeptide (TPR) repeat protein